MWAGTLGTPQRGVCGGLSQSSKLEAHVTRTSSMRCQGSSSDDTAGCEAQWPSRCPAHQLTWVLEWQRAEAWGSVPGGDGRVSGELGVRPGPGRWEVTSIGGEANR